MCTRCLSCISVRSLSKIEFLAPRFDLFQSKTCCARHCPSVLGTALTGKVFRKASAKVRPFSELAKQFNNFFQEK